MRRSLAIALAGCSALVLASPAAAQTRADYVAQVNPICAEATADATPVVRKARLKTPKGVATFYRKIGRIAERELDALQAVPRPPEDAALIGDWLDSLKQQNRLIRKTGKASVVVIRLLTTSPVANIARIQRLTRVINGLNKRLKRERRDGVRLANELGATDCAKGARAPSS